MNYLITSLDHPDRQELRLSTRAAHLKFLHTQHAGLVVIFAGPLLGDDETTMIGSFIVVRANSRSVVEHFCSQDPFRQVGLFAEVHIRAWKWTLGNEDRL